MAIARVKPEQRAAVKAMQNRVEPEEKVVNKVNFTPSRKKSDLGSAEAQAFVSGAPDAGEEVSSKKKTKKKTAYGHVLRGKRIVITLSMPPDLLEKIDKRAQDEGRNRSELLMLLLKKGMIGPERPFIA